MRIALKFAYNGINYHGFARQPNVLTIEEKIIKSLKKIGLLNDIKKSSFRYASRTDKGVSAIGNVFALNIDNNKDNSINILKNLSKNIDDIIYYGIRKVNNEFNPRFAKKRIYRYYFKNNKKKLNKIKKVINLFEGEHDFSNFAKIEKLKNPMKSIDTITIRERDDFFYIEFYAQSFLWHQIRKIISALNKYVNNKIKIEDITQAINNPNIKIDYGLSSPEPLILMDVIYDFNFDYYKTLNKLVEFKKNFLDQIKYHTY
jgi:tRNA pseudouridine38-40 synthase